MPQPSKDPMDHQDTSLEATPNLQPVVAPAKLSKYLCIHKNNSNGINKI